VASLQAERVADAVRYTADKDPRLMGHPEVYELEPFLLHHDRKRFNELKE
jgi:hypothetical protein